MTATATSIKAMFPEFSSQTDAFVEIFISSAQTMLCSSLYGAKYDLAVSYLTAHFMRLSLDSGDSTGGNKTVGSVSVGGTSPADISGYNATGYGRAFLMIKKSVVRLSTRPVYRSAL